MKITLRDGNHLYSSIPGMFVVVGVKGHEGQVGKGMPGVGSVCWSRWPWEYAREKTLSMTSEGCRGGGRMLAFYVVLFLPVLGYCRCRDCPIKVGHSFIVHCLGAEGRIAIVPKLKLKPRNFSRVSCMHRTLENFRFHVLWSHRQWQKRRNDGRTRTRRLMKVEIQGILK